MKKPKSMKGFLTLLITVADSVTSEFKGSDKLTEDEEGGLMECISAIQNRLGDELAELLSRHNLEWQG